MHILFLTDNFPPEVNAPASRTFEHAREWVHAGHQVTILTTVPNFPRGEVFPGYRNRLWQHEVMAGIQVMRVWSFIRPNAGFSRRILDYLSLMVSAVFAGPFVRNVDIVIGTSPQIFAACAAWIISIYKRVPFVFELRDLWPESIRAVGALKSEWWFRRLEALELFLYRRAARIVALTETFRENLVTRGIPKEKIEVVTNGVDRSRYHPLPDSKNMREELGLQGKFVAGYIGTHGLAHGLETLLETAALLSHVSGAQNIVLLFLGDGARKQALINQAQSMKLENVMFLDSVAKDEVVRYWATLDVAIIHLRRNLLFASVIPSKLFECMGMGVPVLHGVPGEAARIVQATGCGDLFEPENAAELANGIMSIQADANRRRKFAEAGLAAATRYDRHTLATRMLAVLEEAARDP